MLFPAAADVATVFGSTGVAVVAAVVTDTAVVGCEGVSVGVGPADRADVVEEAVVDAGAVVVTLMTPVPVGLGRLVASEDS